MLKKIAYHNLKRACLTRFISGGRSQKRPIFCGINGQNIATPTIYGKSSNIWSITPVLMPKVMDLALVLRKPRISPNIINVITKNMLWVAVLWNVSCISASFSVLKSPKASHMRRDMKGS